MAVKNCSSRSCTSAWNQPPSPPSRESTRTCVLLKWQWGDECVCRCMCLVDTAVQWCCFSPFFSLRSADCCPCVWTSERKGQHCLPFSSHTASRPCLVLNKPAALFCLRCTRFSDPLTSSRLLSFLWGPSIKTRKRFRRWQNYTNVLPKSGL